MLVFIALAMLGLAVAAGMQAREGVVARDFRQTSRWSAITLPLLALGLALSWVLIRQPALLWWVPPTGFGVDWQCQENVPPDLRVCFRR